MIASRPILLSLALLSCVSFPACAPHAVTAGSTTRVHVSITPSPDVLPFDPRAARIQGATEQLAEIAGHYVALDVDAAMVPEFRAGFEEALGEAFENVTRDLHSLKERDPAAFAYGVPLLERVSLRYDAVLTRDAASLDTSARVLTIRGPVRTDALVRPGWVLGALRAAYEAFALERYGSATADSIPAAERRAYFEFLRRSEGGKGADLAAAPEAARILQALRLAELSRDDGALSRDLSSWLLSKGSWFVGLYLHSPDEVRAIPEGSTFRQAEAAYGRWMLATYPTADETARGGIARALFVRSFEKDWSKQGGRAHPPFAWPSIDRFAFGLGVVDAWRRAGHPTPVSNPRVDAATAFIACPYAISTNISPRCEHDFYRYATATPDGRRRLAAALIERKDPVLAYSAFRSVRAVFSGSLDPLIALLRAVEAEPTVWRAGLRVLASSGYASLDRAVAEEARRLWIERPERRGTALHLLAHVDEHGQGKVDWHRFEVAFDSKIDREILSVYLDEGPTALALLPVIWPALAKGYSRSALIVPKLDAFLADASVHRMGGGHFRVLKSIIEGLCADKNTSDLDAIRAYIEARVARFPGEPYVKLVEDAASARCKPAKPRPPRKSGPGLSPASKRNPSTPKDWSDPW